MRLKYGVLAGVVLSLCCLVSVPAQDANRRPIIAHDAITTAVRGQAVTVLARVTDDSEQVKSVTLFYSVSKDAAPFRAVMKSSGTAMYYGTIPVEVLESAKSVSYYIEAMDHLEATQETPWYTIAIRDAKAVPPPAPAAVAPRVSAPAPAPEPKRSNSSLTTAAIIGGGAAAIVGGALLLRKSDDGGDSGGGGGGDGVQAGDYDGNVTECFTLEGGTPTCSLRSMSILIGTDGVVSSSTLREGVVMDGLLKGKTFSLAAPLDPLTGSTGQVTYAGTVVEDRIIGEVSGDAVTPDGPGTYSGSFSAQLRK